MKRAANQSGAVMPSQTARQFMSENAVEDEMEQRQQLQQQLSSAQPAAQTHEVSLEVEMKAVSNGSTISSVSRPPKEEYKREEYKEEAKAADPSPAIPAAERVAPQVEKKIEKREEPKDIPLAALGAVAQNAQSSQSPMQQLQIVKLLTDLGDRLRQSEKEREILWKEVEICRKQIADMSGNAGKSEKSYHNLEAQINQREVFVKELVEKQIGLEHQLREQMAVFDTSREEQSRLLDKLNSVETAAGSAIVRVEDVVAENAKLSKKVEQLSQDKVRLVRKLEVVEEALTQTQDILKAKALVLLTDQAVAAKTSLPQTPAWTGDDTLKVAQAAVTPKAAAENSPVSSITASLQQPPKRPNVLLLTILTAVIAGAAAYGVIYMINHFKSAQPVAASENTMDDEQLEPAEKVTSDATQPKKQQEELMARAAQIASQIEPSSLSEQDEISQEDDQLVSADEAQDSFDAAIAAQDKAVANFKAGAASGAVTERIKADKNLPKALAAIEQKAFMGDAAAQHDLAAFYTAGQNGIKTDFVKAAKWFEEAAHNGSANAQYNLGVLYHQGLGVSKDTAKAIEMYRVAASNHHPEALYNLAIAYVEGVGVEYNPQIAATYFEQSANGGIVEAAYSLGLLQENGLLGESQPDEAVFWYKISADKGNAEAGKSLAALKKKLSMTNEDVERVTQRIAAKKDGFLNAEGKASIPEMEKPQQPSKLQNAEPVAAVKAASTVQVKKADVDPVIISQIQEQLSRLGFYKGVPNGTVSPSLTQAIKTYQSKSGLKADGQPSDDLLVQMLASDVEERPAD